MAALVPIKKKPIPGTWGAIERSTFPAWRSDWFYGGAMGGGKTCGIGAQVVEVWEQTVRERRSPFDTY